MSISNHSFWFWGLSLPFLYIHIELSVDFAAIQFILEFEWCSKLDFQDGDDMSIMQRKWTIVESWRHLDVYIRLEHTWDLKGEICTKF